MPPDSEDYHMKEPEQCSCLASGSKTEFTRMHMWCITKVLYCETQKNVLCIFFFFKKTISELMIMVNIYK